MSDETHDFRAALRDFEDVHAEYGPDGRPTGNVVIDVDCVRPTLAALRLAVAAQEKAEAERLALERGEAEEVRIPIASLPRYPDAREQRFRAAQIGDRIFAVLTAVVPLPRPVEIKAEVSDGH